MANLLPPKAPSLPLGSKEYSQQYQDLFSNALRLYFNRLDDAFSNVLNTRGGQYLNIPYGAFSDYLDQTATANTATAMLFRATDFANGVSVVSDTKLTVAQAGIYNLQWSGQFENTASADHDVRVWLKINGTVVVGSTGFFAVPSKHGSVNGHALVGWNYFLSLNANDYVELWWETDSTLVSIQAYAASGNYPSTASLIATMTFVSNIT